ncbi:MAG: response regulator transcription factor [Anaerolineales bacterium]
MSDQTPIRIILTDDHPVVRFGLRQALRGADGLLVVAEAERGDAVEALIEAHNPQVVVLNIRMAGLNGIEVTQRIRARQQQVNILALTSRDDEETVRAAVHAGVDGYLLKTASLEQIIQAIRDVAAGKPAFSPEIAQKANIAGRPASPDLLSPRELEVVTLAGKGYTNKAIAMRLKISNRTVQTHLTRVYHKLNVASRTEAVMRAIAYGWIAAPDFYEI